MGANKQDKKKGVALISVMVVLFVVSILCLSIFSIYRSTFKQTLYSFEVTATDYASLSALNVIISYITNNNDAFLKQYNAFLISNGDNRNDAFIIELTQDDLTADVSITSTQDEYETIVEDDFGTQTYEYIITNYYLESVASSENINYSATTYIDIKETSSNTFETYFNIGDYKY